MEIQEVQGQLAYKDREVMQELLASKGLQVTKGHKDLKDRLVHWDQLVLLETLEAQENLDQWGQLELQEIQEVKVCQEPQAQEVLQVALEYRDLLGRWVHEEIKESLDQQVQKVILVHQELLDSEVTLGPLVRWALLVQLEPKEILDQLDH